MILLRLLSPFGVHYCEPIPIGVGPQPVMDGALWCCRYCCSLGPFMGQLHSACFLLLTHLPCLVQLILDWGSGFGLLWSLSGQQSRFWSRFWSRLYNLMLLLSPCKCVYQALVFLHYLCIGDSGHLIQWHREPWWGDNHPFAGGWLLAWGGGTVGIPAPL